MTTIRLTNDDLRMMISEAVSQLCEGQWYEYEPLCRLPYFVAANFSDHAFDRESEREIHEQDIIEDLKLAVRDIIDGYANRLIKPDDYIKVVDRSTSMVIVCGIHPTFNRKRLQQIVVVTTYIWDGRTNIDRGDGKTYYVNEPSEEFLEAKQWNEENQDKVIPYVVWKRDTDIKRQRRKADNKHYWRNNPPEVPREKRMNRLDQAFDRYERKQQYDMEDSLSDEDRKAIQDYLRDMDKRKIELEPVSEIVRRATFQALQEALTDSTNANMLMAKRVGNDEFYTHREDVDKELCNYSEFFRGKSIYCPCDGPQSQIFQYFRDNFNRLGINDLVASSFSFTSNGYIIYIDHEGNVHQGNLQGDGDFRSEECQRLMSKCDIVVTNPPFTLFSDIVNQCQKYGKKFLLLGNKNAASTKALFGLMKAGEVKYGYTKPGEFTQPEGDQIKRMGGLTRWFTNLPVKSDKRFSPSVEYDPNRHVSPDNETDDVINIDSIRDIPYDYDGKMLVPISIFDAGLDPEEYDILKLVRPVVGGKKKFVRVLIQRKQKEPELVQMVMNEVFKKLRKLL